jgi:hypothetical protein
MRRWSSSAGRRRARPRQRGAFKTAREKRPRKPRAQGSRCEAARRPQKRGACHLDISVPGALELSFLPAEQKDPVYDSSATKGSGGLQLVLSYHWKDSGAGRSRLPRHPEREPRRNSDYWSTRSSSLDTEPQNPGRKFP